MKLGMRIYFALIERYLSFKRRQIFNRGGDKVAVISFVLYPKIFNRRYLTAAHNNRMTCKIMVDALVARGFCVHVHHYLDENILTEGVSFFVGHNRTFSVLAKRMPENCVTMVVTSGSSPQFDNQAVAARAAYFSRRSGLSITHKPMSGAHVQPNIDAADKAMMLGNDTVIATWPPEYKAKRVVYRNITLFKPVRKQGRTTTFLYLSSIGVMRRGLDLAIEAFDGLPYNLIVCSPCKGEEAWFFDYYAPLFARCPNIRLCGYVDTSSPMFRDLVREADFGILPSCSEGQAGSALNMMTLGLLPVISENVGFPDVDRYGFTIRDDTVEGLRALVQQAVATPDVQIEAKRDVLLEEVEKYQPQAFAVDFAHICDNLGFSSGKH